MSQLTAPQERRLAELEAIIDQSSLKPLVKSLAKMRRRFEESRAAVFALAEIRDEGLYLRDAGTFEEYTRVVWSIEANWFRRLHAWCKVNEIAGVPQGTAEIPEKQARQLNSTALKRADETGSDFVTELKTALQERQQEIMKEEEEIRQARASEEKPVKDWRDAVRAKLASCLKLCRGKDKKLEGRIKAAIDAVPA